VFELSLEILDLVPTEKYPIHKLICCRTNPYFSKMDINL
jgi:hypothetical protein